ncbi:hypothetical protein KAT80_01355 [Candidatus Pacearchaeota archaeon]|nr:hypothetical protein [Candidatus Pacearchaeota archaeon]
MALKGKIDMEKMRTNGEICLDNFRGNYAKKALIAMIQNFPIDIRVTPRSKIKVETYDDGRIIELHPQGSSVDYFGLNNLDKDRYNVCFSSSSDGFGNPRCLINDSKQKCRLELYSIVQD